MSPELLDIQPRELKFTFELKKQSSCSVQLVNNTNQYVAFKVKTTAPRKYCVRPNTGIVQPKSTCDFTVTMQAQRQAPPDMQCKDKFLIQSRVVPFGTTEEGITAGMFTKDNGKYIEENKLKVVLVSPPHSPVLVPINGALKQEPSYEASILRDQELSGVENLASRNTVAKAGEEWKPREDVDLKPDRDVEDLQPREDVDLEPARDVEELQPGKDVDLKPAKDVEELKLAKELEEMKLAKELEELKLAKEIEELKSAKTVEELNLKLTEWKSKLSEAEITISKLREERTKIIQEKEELQQELQKSSVKQVHVGFPLLFVCMVALIGVALGYLLRS